VRLACDTERPSSTALARRWVPVVVASRCTGCGRCVAACPSHVLSLEPRGWVKSAVIGDLAACTGCKKCEIVCPFNAISMVRTRPVAGS
jgi:ferredoxin